MVFFSARIGLMVKKPESNFSNGCVQQTIFIKEMLEHMGYFCEIITIEPDYKVFHDTGDKIKFINFKSNLSSFKLFIFISLNLNNGLYKDHIANIKRYNIKCVNLICGNLYILHQEEFVFNVHGIIKDSLNDTLFDENWVLEMYPFMIDYISLLTNKPTYLLPYCWNNTIVKKYIQKKKLDLELDYHKIGRKKINILIYEPNMSIHKTCLIPLLICEKYYNTYGDNLNKVFVFCGSKAVIENNNPLVSSLNIYKDNKMEVYGRLIMPDTLDLIRKNNNYVSVVLSHNIMNNLNFLHLEMLFLDVPIIHNCEPFKANSLYYDDYSTNKVIDMIENVRNLFFNTSDYRNNKSAILTKYSPTNKEIQSKYNKRIETLADIGLKMEDNMIPFVKNLVKISKFIKDHAKVNSSLFYNGVGITILYENDIKINLLHKTINSLLVIRNTLNVEILFCKEMIDYEKLVQFVNTFQNDFFNIHLMSIADNIDQLKDTLNIYMATSFTSFEKGITVLPGVMFTCNNVSDFLDTELNEDSNSVKYFTHYEKINTMSKDNLQIYKSVSEILFPDTGIDVTKEVCLKDVLLYDKSSSQCLKVIGTMCELRKANNKTVDDSNILECICELNFNNTSSKIECAPYLYGKFESKFLGYGLLYKYKASTTDCPIAITYTETSFDNDKNIISVPINADTICVNMVDNKMFSFSGKGEAKKLQSTIKAIICDAL